MEAKETHLLSLKVGSWSSTTKRPSCVILAHASSFSSLTHHQSSRQSILAAAPVLLVQARVFLDTAGTNCCACHGSRRENRAAHGCGSVWAITFFCSAPFYFIFESLLFSVCAYFGFLLLWRRVFTCALTRWCVWRSQQWYVLLFTLLQSLSRGQFLVNHFLSF